MGDINQEAQARALMHKMREMKAQERAAFIERCCGGNPRLRWEVESLLRDDECWELQDEASQASGSGQAIEGSKGPAETWHAAQEIGPYIIEGVIAEGGSSTVYRARHTSPSRLVALKVLRNGGMDAVSKRRFEREAQTLAKLDHPGIAHLYTFGTTKGPVPQMYMAMELVEGEPITLYSWRHGLDVQARVKLLIQACEAADYGHRRGIVHRDIKPANVLVSSGVEGSGAGGGSGGSGTSGAGGGSGGSGGVAKERVRLIDYGIAIRAGDSLQMTTFGFMVGTLAYMSPEQIRLDPELLDARTDVYSLGVVLYELCCGQVPFASASGAPMEMLRRIGDEDPPRLGSVKPSLRGDLEVIAAKALARDVTMRYQTAHEFAEDLRRYIEKRPIRARIPSVGYYLGSFVKRNRALSGALLGLGLMGLVAAGLAVRDSIESRAQARIAEQDALLWQELLESMWRVPGSHAVRLEILGKAIPYLEGKVHERPEDVPIAMALARAYQTWSEVDLETGQYAECQKIRMLAHDLLVRASQIGKQSRGPTIQKDLAREVAKSKVLLGDVVKQLGFDGAMFEYYNQAMAIHEDLFAQYPDHEGVADDLYWSYQRLADQYIECGDQTSTQEMMAKQLETAQRNFSRWPHSPRVNYSLAFALLHDTHWKRLQIDPQTQQISRALELAWPVAFSPNAVKHHISFFVNLASRAAYSAILRGDLIESAVLVDACDVLRLRGPSPGQEPLLDEALMHSLRAKSLLMEKRGDQQAAAEAIRLGLPYAHAMDAGGRSAKQRSEFWTTTLEGDLARLQAK